MTVKLANSAIKPRLALTLGDPAGIGPEVILKALADASLSRICEITLIGTRQLWEKTYFSLRSLANFNSEQLVDLDTISYIDVPADIAKIDLGTGNAASGAASFSYLETALKHTLRGEFQGIVTAPIAKNYWQVAGYNYPGQTEVLASAAGVDKFGMLFVAQSPYTGWTLRTLLATTHIPLSQVPQILNPELMSVKLELLIDCLKKDFGLEQAKIAIAGLNPHSGEQGQLGKEEQDWLIPWLESQRKKYPHLELIGPVPPDTMWVEPGQAWYGYPHLGELNQAGAAGYLALYHDQGLIPVKLMAFEQAVNTTIGLPFIRTSPDHGTAFDIAGQGIAKAESMKAALKLAAQLAKQRQLEAKIS